MPSAEIITIGTEILLGEILDTNARYIACTLRDNGIDLFRKTTVGDNPVRIAGVIREALERCDIVIMTGGLGPTVDDPTREAAALAAGVETEFRPELWEQIQERFSRWGRRPTENNRRQAYVPKGALVIENPVGTAPAFTIETGSRSVIALPGVPSEMEYLLDHAVLPYLRQRFSLAEVIKARVLHTAGVGESIIDERIGDLERLENPTVGLAAHSGQVDVRIVAKAATETAAATAIQEVELELRRRLGDWIYGADAETLESIAMAALERRGWTLAVVEAGLGGELARRLSASSGPFRGAELLAEAPDPEALDALTGEYQRSRGASVGLGVAVYPQGRKHELVIVLHTPDGNQRFSRSYGGPPDYAPRYAAHHGLDLIRRV
jgi:competence/damage-inducible protein CinA-like protein